ncbi:MAG TPA: class I SAM-dependent methyltransferase [Candidatus Saccharimonadales bacterium]|nr:class I SAM-dependent methyltransferase [Candidatus Saccharimonadales bacterium]
MRILSTPGWEDYELLDSGDGKRFERFGKYRLVRPDPQIIWKPRLSISEWQKADAEFDAGKKEWVVRTHIPDKWLLKYKDISFYAKLSPFKHTGIFPEQTLQWEWISSVMVFSSLKRQNQQRNNNSSSNSDTNLRVLNLFGYTGIASLVSAVGGASVTHVDASRPTIGWARENQDASGLNSKPIRWILDDAVKFVQREVKRGVKYDGIIMDPPVYGHGPTGEKWDFNESFPTLLSLCRSILSENPSFILINAYAISSSALMLENVLADYVGDLKGTVEVGELALEEKSAKRLLSTGIFARWSK